MRNAKGLPVQMKTFINLLRAALNPKRLPVMLRKVLKRAAVKRGNPSESENLDWLRTHSSSMEEFAGKLNPELWQEAGDYESKLQRHAAAVLERIGHQLGGGGAYRLLYFLTRYLKPDCIVETGVAAGYSTHAFLTAIQNNGKGRLFSSDFPYFRLSDPERYIGVLVEQELKSDWELFIDGDRANLPRILKRADRIDLFHYDSDKSYSGRRFAVSQIERKMSPQAVMIFDDIQDNSHFHDYVEGCDPSSWSVFAFEGKYIGVVGQL